MFLILAGGQVMVGSGIGPYQGTPFTLAAVPDIIIARIT